MASKVIRTEPATIHRRDYQPPSYFIESIYLSFRLMPEQTLVTSTTKYYRNTNHEGSFDILHLDGENLHLVAVEMDGSVVAEDQYFQDDTGLTLYNPPAEFTLEITTKINPQQNKALSGLYRSSGNYCTQCEAEGFRRITYYLDRPDVLARYTTRIEADKTECPVLLANGNLIEAGEIDSDKHYAIWEDPFPKPSYLFALVAGGLVEVQDKFTTNSGREVALKIFVEPQNQDKCAHAMGSLKKAMRWDEQTYGLEYDLDTYMIVAVDDFNMGAMENKGLNIFNSKYVLASPQTATDQDYKGIQGVIGHEYFHNWTGNRVTCRDWFQLSLKEGLTVFRDQEFSADLNSRAVKRIEDVKILRNSQFREDAGPMAHPVRPESYVEINNFYTLTVYNKGAEVVRMLHRIIGADAFRRGMDIYFERYDGMAVTCDDFVNVMAEAASVDLEQFKLWYGQAGTPVLEVSERWNPEQGQYSLNISQSCPPTPGQESKNPFHIPILVSLLDADKIRNTGELNDRDESQHLLELKDKTETFAFNGFSTKPVLSFLREFTAPVKVNSFQEKKELAFLMAHDSDDYNRWDAAFKLSTAAILEAIQSIERSQQPIVEEDYLQAFAATLNTKGDHALTALALTLPDDFSISQHLEIIDPAVIHQAILFVGQVLKKNLHDQFTRVYQECSTNDSHFSTSENIARRKLKNCCLAYLLTPGVETINDIEIALNQYKNSTNMTDVIAALASLSHLDSEEKEKAFSDFYSRWQNDPLVVDKWLMLQATSSHPKVLSKVKELLGHPAFSLENPNKVRSLIGAFCSMNHYRFHDESGAGYRFLIEQIGKLDQINPQIAARLISPLISYAKYTKKLRVQMEEQLRFLAQKKNLSADVYEIVKKCLDN